MFYLSVHWVVISFVLMVQPFLTQVPTFLCKDPLDPTKMYECEEAQSCREGVVVSSDFPYNLAIEFKLYCDRAGLRDLVGSIFFLGGSIGTLVFSHVSDTYGRKTALFMAYVTGTIGIVVCGISPNLTLFLIFLAASWGGYDAYFAFSFIILNESGGVKLRGISNATLLIVWAVGVSIFVGIAYVLPNWRHQVIWTMAVPGVLFIVFFAKIQESPRFLLAKGKLLECEQALRKIAKVNNREKRIEYLIDPSSVSKSVVLSKVSHFTSYAPSSSSPTSYLTILTNKWLRKRFFLFTLLIIYLFLSYNGILFALASLGGNIYVNSLIVNAAELLAYIASIFMLGNVKRKRSLLIIMLISAGGGLVFALIPFIQCENYIICSEAFLKGAMSLVIKFAVSLSFGLIYVYGSELFPTTMRSKCIGVAAATGRATGIVITWINSGLLNLGINPVLFYGLLGFLVMILLKWLPETFGSKLLDDIPSEELEEVDLGDMAAEEEELDAQERLDNMSSPN